MNDKYFAFVLGYDLLHKELNKTDCDTAFMVCCDVYNDFLKSDYNVVIKSEYQCLNEYVNDNIEDIKKLIELYEKNIEI